MNGSQITPQHCGPNWDKLHDKTGKCLSFIRHVVAPYNALRYYYIASIQQPGRGSRACLSSVSISVLSNVVFPVAVSVPVYVIITILKFPYE